MRLIFKAKKAPVGTVRKRKSGEFEKRAENYWVMVKQAVHHSLKKNGINPDEASENLHEELGEHVNAVRTHVDAGRKFDNFWDGLTNIEDDPYSPKHKKIVNDAYLHLKDLMNPKVEQDTTASTGYKISEEKQEMMNEQKTIGNMIEILKKHNKDTPWLKDASNLVINKESKPKLEEAGIWEDVKKILIDRGVANEKRIKEVEIGDSSKPGGAIWIGPEEETRLYAKKYNNYLIGGPHFAPFVARMAKYLDVLTDKCKVDISSQLCIVPLENAERHD
jgi:hypothetical protein